MFLYAASLVVRIASVAFRRLSGVLGGVTPCSSRRRRCCPAQAQPSPRHSRSPYPHAHCSTYHPHCSNLTHRLHHSRARIVGITCSVRCGEGS
jgi:hypothetical protein